ncbi:MAG: protein kinase [Planctomycetes bacterium]|nr:protein kinase [Planctomycetota bacterium]
MQPALRDPDDDERLESLVAECLRGLWSEGSGAVERVCAEHPELASEIRASIAALGPLTSTPFWSEAQPHRTMPAEDSRVPEQLGDYLLLRRLGGGGMGVVFLAEERALRRRVALKLIRAEHLYLPGARKRFHREVTAVAQLQHPGIVKLFSVHQQVGIPMLAMEWLEGRSLGEILHALQGRNPAELRGLDLAHAAGIDVAALPAERARVFSGSWVECCLRIVADVADALGHAHSRGVIHRDVKPSNVMLTVQGRAVLIDFGLARLAEPGALTETATQPGSLAYMSPEQVRGDGGRADPRSDLWSLGVTLFELLTLKLPFTAANGESLRRSILEARFPEMRRWNPDLTWEVETVCRSVMDPDAERRYASAAEFAADLDNVLARRPLRARRAGPWLRARRWAQRQPARAVALGMLAAILLFGPLALWWQERRAAHLVRAAQTQVEAFGLGALEVVERMLTRVATHELEHVPRSGALRTALLADAVGYYEAFLRQGVLTERFGGEKAWVQKQLGELYVALGRAREGAALLGDAVRQLAELADAHPQDGEAWERHRRALAALGAALQHLGRTEDAASAYSAALARARAWPEGHPFQRADHFTTASVLNAMHEPADRRAQPAGVEAARRAVQIFTELCAADPAEPRYLRGLCAAEGNLGQMLLYAAAPVPAGPATRPAVGPHPAEAPLRRALEVHAALAALGPVTPTDRQRRVADLARLGRTLLPSRPEEGRALLQEAIAEGERCAAEYPDLVTAHWSTVEALTVLGARLPPGDPEREELLLRATRRAEELRRSGEPSPTSLWLMAETCQRLAATYVDRLEAAEPWHRAAIEVGERILAHFGELVPLVQSLQDQGMAFDRHGRTEEAEASYRRVLQVWSDADARASQAPEAVRVALGAGSRLGRLLVRSGRLPEAVDTLRRARDLALRTAPEGGAAVVSAMHLATALVESGRLGEARAELERTWAAAGVEERSPAERQALDALGQALMASESADAPELLVRVAARIAQLRTRSAPPHVPVPPPGRSPRVGPRHAPLDLLREAVRRGYRDAAFLESEALAPLRAEPGFTEVLESARR